MECHYQKLVRKVQDLAAPDVVKETVILAVTNLNLMEKATTGKLNVQVINNGKVGKKGEKWAFKVIDFSQKPAHILAEKVMNIKR